MTPSRPAAPEAPQDEPRLCVIAIALDGFPPLPNVKRHWAVKAEDNRTWRGAAHLTALQAIRESSHSEDFPLTRALVELVVIRPDAHWPDDDNAIAAVKPIFDGMTDAKVWLDDRVVRVRGVRHETGPKSLRIEIVFGAA